MLACDTEDDSKGRTYMVNFFDGENHFTFRSTSQATEWLNQYSRCFKKGVEVWFANMQYDIGNVYRESQEFLSFNLAGSRFISGKVYQERIHFRDVLNVIPGSSVKSLGNMIGLKKIETKDFNNEKYCQVDTEIVYWAKLNFQKALKKLNIDLRNTAAGTGFAALLKMFSPLEFNSLDDEAHEFMKQGYYGGRTEVFHTAKLKGEIYSYDIISSYPSVMRDIPLVNTHSGFYTKKPNFKREGMIDLIIECPQDLKIPYLPVRYKDDKTEKLIFPTGTIRGVYTYFEIREALKLGYTIKKTINALEFAKNYTFKLDKFVDKIFALRQKAKKNKDAVMDYACKIILNASYGKFALGNDRTQLITLDELDKTSGEFSSEIFPNNQVIVKKKTNYMPSTNYLTAAMITAYGRHNLYQYLIKATENGRTLFYCDTDSIFFRGPAFPDSMLGKNLGDLELQHEISEAHFILPKTYYIKWKSGEKKYKCKGVRGELAELFFTKGFAENMQPLKYVETCRKNFQIHAKNKKFASNNALLPFNLWVKKPKSLKSKYDKRELLLHGTTKPINLEYDLESNEYI